MLVRAVRRGVDGVVVGWSHVDAVCCAVASQTLADSRIGQHNGSEHPLC